MSDLVGVIDCGTNTTRLLISDGTNDVVRRGVVTGLGVGVDAGGRIGEETMARTLATLGEYRDALAEHGVTRTRMVTTSAVRDASNRDEFLEKAEQTLGVKPEILSGEEEGRLSFAGATAGFGPGNGPFCVIDLGGGSTEFSYGNETFEKGISTEMGSVRFTERFIEHDPPWAYELSNVISVVEAHLTDVVRELPEILSAKTFVGVAGTITTMAAVEIGSPVGDHEATHHFRLTHEAAEDVFRTLVTEKYEDRIYNPGLAKERGHVIVGGSTILVAIMRVLDLDSIVVSESDILDGLVASLA